MDVKEAAELGRKNILSNRLLGEWQASQGLQGVLINLIEQGLGVDDGKDAAKERSILRQFVFGFLFAELLNVDYRRVSSKMLTPDCWYALYRWVAPTKDQETGAWRSDNVNFSREVLILADQARAINEEAKRRELELLGQLGFDI